MLYHAKNVWRLTWCPLRHKLRLGSLAVLHSYKDDSSTCYTRHGRIYRGMRRDVGPPLVLVLERGIN
jgi:hypothetical protein